MNALTLRLRPIRSLTLPDDASSATRVAPSDDRLNPPKEFGHRHKVVELDSSAEQKQAASCLET